jgi:hypothetical protein
MPLLPTLLSIVLAVAARELFLPVAGHVRDSLHDVRTSVTLVNAEPAAAHATIRFVPAVGTPSPEFSLDVAVPAHGSRSVDPFSDRGGIGALRITSDCPLAGKGTIFNPTSSSAIDLLPAPLAIGSGDAATAGSFSFTRANSETNRLYVVETAGDALQYSVMIVGADRQVLSQNMHLIHPFEQQSLDLDGDFPTVAASNASVRIRGFNGGGRVLAAVAVTKRPGGEIALRPVALAAEHSHGLSTAEKLAYAATALFIVGLALRRMR